MEGKVRGGLMGEVRKVKGGKLWDKMGEGLGRHGRGRFKRLN